ncbi:MAG: putative lipid II flippase FtsW [Pseudomonadota bacterium]|nr:putative lipid II flippase FtsW [Pseudomonadota bacterium]
MMTANAMMPFPVRLRNTIKVDSVLLVASLALLFGGLIVLASASISRADNVVGDPFYYVGRQAVAAVIGGIAGSICLFVPMSFWRSTGPLMLLIAFSILVLVLVPGLGYTANGSTRWIRLGFINLQASEVARLCMMIYLAGYLVRHNKTLQEQLSGFVNPMIVLFIACCLLLAEPDFGAAIVLVATAFSMMFVAGARLRDFFIFLLLAVVGATMLAITRQYRLERLTGFLDPWADPYDKGFQLTQSLIAIGRGEWFGVGLGDSVQKLFYLPDAHTDFVFAVYAEEFGLLGSFLLVLLFVVMLWRIFKVGIRAAGLDRFFEAYLAVGIGTWLGLQAFINIGVNMGLLPTKGLTLPLVSYGRSSLIVTMVSLSILFRIHHELETGSRTARSRRPRSGTAGGRQ